MKRPFKLLVIILIFLLVLLIADTVILNYMFIPKPYYGRELYVFSQFPGADVFGFVEENDIFKIAIYYPVMKTYNLNRVVLDYVAHTRQSFIDELEYFDKDKLSLRPAFLNISFEIVPFGEKLYTYIFTTEKFFNSIRQDKSSGIFLADTHRLGWVKPLDIFDGTQENREEIYGLLLGELEKRDGFEALYFPQTLEDRIMSLSYDFHNLYFTREGAVFRFDKYEIAAGAAGVVEVALPKEDILHLLTPRWQERLSLEEDIEQIYFDPEEACDNYDGDLPGKRAALIFTGGPDPKSTPDILDVLSKYDVKATFFLVGQRAVFYPGMVREIVRRGHEIGNFSYSYKDFSVFSREEIKGELDICNHIIESCCGVTPLVFSPPFGSIKDNMEFDTMTMIIPDREYEELEDEMGDGVIIRFYDGKDQTADELAETIDRLRYHGYGFLTAKEIIRYRSYDVD